MEVVGAAPGDHLGQSRNRTAVGSSALLPSAFHRIRRRGIGKQDLICERSKTSPDLRPQPSESATFGPQRYKGGMTKGGRDLVGVPE